ncbi:hypothetical protein SCALM49S_00513 [Streptomyces californicus]
MVHIGTVVMGAMDVARAAAFWKAALTYTEREPGDGRLGGAGPGRGSGVGVALALDVPGEEVPGSTSTSHPDTQEAEVERLIGLGATRVAWDLYPPDPDFVVLADPEGNRFCVIDTTTARTGRARGVSLVMPRHGSSSPGMPAGRVRGRPGPFPAPAS